MQGEPRYQAVSIQVRSCWAFASRAVSVAMVAVVIGLCTGQSCSPSSALPLGEPDEQVQGYLVDPPADPSVAPQTPQTPVSPQSPIVQEPANSPITTQPPADPAAVEDEPIVTPTDPPVEPPPAGLPILEVRAEPQSGQTPLSVTLRVSADLELPSDAAYHWQYGTQSAQTSAAELAVVLHTAGVYEVSVCATSSSWPSTSAPCAATMVVAQAEPVANAPNQPPVAFQTQIMVEHGTATVLEITGADPESAALTFSVGMLPAAGTLGPILSTGPQSAQVVYTPATGYSGADEFSFRVSDGVDWSEAARVDIFVFDPAIPPMVAGIAPNWPLKTQRVLYTDAQIATARELCRTERGAIGVADKLRSESAFWIGKSNEWLRATIPDARIWRAANLSVGGCPIHGSAVFAHGSYPWILDRERPLCVRCPVGGETYPSNDCEALYRSDFRDPRLKNGPYADLGQGWISPGGEKYSFAPHAVFRHWFTTWRYAVTSLSRAYITTGERIYAEKALVLLDRMAEVYPFMDYSIQFAEPTPGGRVGRAITSIWECYLARDLAIAYDLVWDALVSDNPVQFSWRSAEAIRANIEGNLLEQIIEAVERDQIRGNYTLHQTALAYAAAVRQQGPTASYLNSMLYQTGSDPMDEGIEYAMYNFFYKDGFPSETAPGYNFIPLTSFTDLARPLLLVGYDFYAHPKTKLILDGPLSIISTGQFTPNVGDAGTIYSGWIGPSTAVYRPAFARFGQPEYAWALSRLNDLNYTIITSFDGLFEPSLVLAAREAAGSYVRRPPSRFLDGYGMVILNNAADTNGLSAYYGVRGGHGHKDRLGIELYSNGRRVSPDIGYPDVMNAYTPSVQAWTQNTVSHNCVVVDDRMQDGNSPGRLLRFHEHPGVDYVDLNGQGSYAQCDIYRRSLLLVDAGPNTSYLVDVFRVRGGSRHVLSLHGMAGTFSTTGATFTSPVTQGTLAGLNVPYGQIYDDPVLGASGYTGPYSGYRGSGYQYLFNWQQAVPTGLLTASWQTTSQPAGLLRVHVPARAGQDVIVADAYASPVRKIPDVLKYMLLRRDSAADGNTFVTVWEMTEGVPFIDGVSLHEVSGSGTGAGQVVALTVRRGASVDTIAIAPQSGTGYGFMTTFPAAGVWTSDAAAFLVTEASGTWQRRFVAGGTYVNCTRSGLGSTPSTTVEGEIISADYQNRRIIVAPSPTVAQPSVLVGRTIRIHNDLHSAAYLITSAEKMGSYVVLYLGGSDVITGRILVGAVNAQAKTVTTPTLIEHEHRLAGMTLVNHNSSYRCRILQASSGLLTVDGQASLFPVAQNAWIADFGVGDRVVIEGSFYAEK